ncbi:MAG: septum site-determining protein MinC [Firmicutes bacterium]|nr:septum site-determining protein MinC [Bacillota bacterium]
MDIKGDRRGLRLVISQVFSPDALAEELRRTLAARAAFLGRASLVVELPEKTLTPQIFSAITEVFEEFPNLSLRGVQEREASNLLALDHRPADRLVPPKVLRQTVRSGQRISHPGDLIVVGDVNPGATLMAGGDIMVFGWLRGVAYAGQPDDATRAIYALRFDPSQVRIAGMLALGNADGSGTPEKALIENGEVVVKPWQDIRLPEVVTHDRNSWLERFSSATPS